MDWRIPKYVPTGIVRWVFNRPCREPFCNQRRTCWRWHIEGFTCRVCGREATENDMDAFRRITKDLMSSVNQYEAEHTWAWNWNPQTGSFEPMRLNGTPQ